MIIRGLIAAILLATTAAAADVVSVGPRPFFLIDRMSDGALKEKLLSCADQPVRRTKFSIAHRGAPLQFPEHTEEGYRAAARMGAGVIECDVTFTKDKELVCRHSQNDLHQTTNILASDLAETCVTPFTPATEGAKAKAECRASDVTLEEFRTLRGKMDATNPSARTVEDYLGGVSDWRTGLYAATGGRLTTHAESIALFRSLGAKFTPELKRPAVAMPFDDFTQEDYAQKLIDEYKAAGIPPSDVWAQSFSLDDVLYWIRAEPEFGAQAVFLDSRYRTGLDPNDPATFSPDMAELKAMGVNYISPPMWMLVSLDGDQIVPSAYAREAKAAGLKTFTWTLERSGPLNGSGGWYFQSIRDAVDGDGVIYELLDVLAQDVGVEGVFSDWPATVSYYASCMGLE